MKKKYKFSSKLFVLILLIIILAIAIGIWQYFEGRIPIGKWSPQKLTNANPIIVTPLETSKEKTLGTIIYSATQITSDLKADGQRNTITLESPDSFEAVVEIYSQDLLNRYPDSQITKKNIIKEDSMNKRAVVLNCHTSESSLTIISWPKSNGMTAIEISKDS